MKKSAKIITRIGWSVALTLVFGSLSLPVFAQVAVTLPDTSQTTTLNAVVAEQAKVQVPAAVSFTVNDISAITYSANQSVTITNIALATATKQLQISLQANAANFTPPVALAATWAASAISWDSDDVWTNATQSTGTLSSSAYTTVATCTANSAGCSTTGMVFNLAANTSVLRSGTHSLVVTWKFASIGT
jgi:hypothetical protein